MLVLFKVNMERRSSPMSGQRASQTQLLNTVIGLNTAQREPLSDVSELQPHDLLIGLVQDAAREPEFNAPTGVVCGDFVSPQ
jgi:hypothetical protein